MEVGSKVTVEGEDDDGSGTDSDDSDTVAEKEELATQSSLLDMYQTLLQRSDNQDSPQEQVCDTTMSQMVNSI